jgi:hypothetical protein
VVTARRSCGMRQAVRERRVSRLSGGFATVMATDDIRRPR